MKHLILSLFTLHFSLFTSLFASPFAPNPETEVVVYSSSSSSPLHVSTISANPQDSAVSRTFPSSYTGHRSVCPIPRLTTNDCFCAWSGGISYTPGDPFGVSSGSDYPIIGLTAISPITPRINLVSGVSDRAMTFDQILDDLRARLPPSETAWIDNNRITTATIEGGSFKGQRIRVVRWLINDLPLHIAGSNARVVLDKNIETDVRTCLTEAYFLVCPNDIFDLDWEHLHEEVIMSPDVRRALKGEEVRRVCYLIVVGDGATSWELPTATNEVCALPPVITRYYGNSQVKPSQMTSVVKDGKTTVRWLMDCPFEEGYTAFRIVVSSGASTVFDSGKFYAMPINGRNIYSHTLNHTFNTGTYDWKIAAFNSKYSQDTSTYYTNGVPFTVTGE